MSNLVFTVDGWEVKRVDVSSDRSLKKRFVVELMDETKGAGPTLNHALQAAAQEVQYRKLHGNGQHDGEQSQ